MEQRAFQFGVPALGLIPVSSLDCFLIWHLPLLDPELGRALMLTALLYNKPTFPWGFLPLVLEQSFLSRTDFLLVLSPPATQTAIGFLCFGVILFIAQTLI